MPSALDIGADAVHPDHGLLAKNPALADACAESGITSIGPSANVIRLMSNKRRARHRVS